MEESLTVQHCPYNARMSEGMLDLVASRFRILGEPYRLRILQLLRRGEMSVAEIVDALDGTQPNVSRHLQLLSQSGIVVRRREGSKAFYSLKKAAALTLCELVHKNLT